jgi:hypothetical protein
LSTIEIGPLESWAIDQEYPTPSDHETISFSWEDPETDIASKHTTGWKIDQLAQDKNRVIRAREDWLQRSQQSPINITSIDNIKELDRGTLWI